MKFMNDILKELYIKRFNEEDSTKLLSKENYNDALSMVNDILDDVLFQKFHDEEWKAKAFVILNKIDNKTLELKYPHLNDNSKYLDMDIISIKKRMANDLIELVNVAFEDMSITFKMGGAK